MGARSLLRNNVWAEPYRVCGHGVHWMVLSTWAPCALDGTDARTRRALDGTDCVHWTVLIRGHGVQGVQRRVPLHPLLLQASA
eukprot:1827564-Rhodomonas_salina.1